MKFSIKFGLMALVVLFLAVGMVMVANSVVIASDRTGCSEGGGGMWTPKCPFCQSILPPNGDVASPFYTTYHTDIWGNKVMDTVVKCKVCGYDGTRNANGMIRSISQEQLAEWGARNWEINKK